MAFPRPQQLQAMVAALEQVFVEGRHADQAIQEQFKKNTHWGTDERGLMAEVTYDMVRFYRLLSNLAGREPIGVNDWWQMCAILYVLKGENPPNWEEFANLNREAIKDRYQDLRSQRAIRESIPDWLDDLGEKELGSLWGATIHSLNKRPHAVLRVNRLKANVETVVQTLESFDIRTRRVGEDALLAESRGELFINTAFKDGLYEVQDLSSQLVAPFLEPKAGMRIIDACAGNGGKTMHLAALMGNKGRILALDTEEWKLEHLKKRARRVGATIIETRQITTTKVIKRLDQSADRVLLDVPCSGLGIFRRHPDARWTLSMEQIQRLQETQRQILQSYSRMVKPGGMLVYSTCSILPSENQEQVQFFLQQPDCAFELVAEQTILPQERGFDGFYMARLLRKA
jgi:16S rRNA (cytosine967-C5)-methyltransferase